MKAEKKASRGKLHVDKTDEKIIGELLENSKASLRGIAAKLGVSFVTVRNRINELERSEVIEKYTTKIDYYKLGYDVHVMIEVRISKGRLFELEKKIAKHPNVYGVYDMTGDFDAVLLGRFKSTRLMDKFLKEIQTYDFVERTHTNIILNTIKESGMRI
jgi:DNA-binding Lrp family transcriptional regulator